MKINPKHYLEVLAYSKIILEYYPKFQQKKIQKQLMIAGFFKKHKTSQH
jgi:hypothetical protein